MKSVKMTNTESRNSDLGYEVERNAKWHYDKDIVDNGVEDKQIRKLIEEVHEVEEALQFGADDIECMKEIGDVITVVINLCERRGYTIEDCLKLTNDKLSKRTGKKVNGVFVKSEDL